MKKAPLPTSPQIVYLHPDGFKISYSHLSRSLECCDESDSFTLDIPIGPDGLIALGLALIAAGHALNVNAKGAEQ